MGDLKVNSKIKNQKVKLRYPEGMIFYCGAGRGGAKVY
jgi:hypothetical protein